MNNMEYVNRFISHILGKDCKFKDLAKILFKNEDDCKKFYNEFLGRNSRIIDDLLDFRECKILTSDVDIDKIIDIWDNNNIANYEELKNLLENIFFQPFNMDEVEFIYQYISDGKSFKLIYDKFKNNINENIFKFVL